MKFINLKGVTQNNLKNIDIKIPLRSFVVICGPSGSGKSSLAFQTLFAEGQRRYLESLSNYAKQFIQDVSKPLIESAENIPPAIALEQKNPIKSSRSTLGTHSEIYDYLRSFFAQIGTPYCPNHKTQMKKFDASIATHQIFTSCPDKRIYLICKLQWKNKTEASQLKIKIIQKGYYKALLFDSKNKEMNIIDLEFENFPSLSKTQSLYLIMDRLIIEEDAELRIFDAISQSFELSKALFGTSYAQALTTEGDFFSFKKQLSCSQCDEVFWDLSPQLFSFNNPVGACKDCSGFGNTLTLDKDKIIPNVNLPLEKAILPFQMPSAKNDLKKLKSFCLNQKITASTLWKDLSKKEQELIWEGDTSWKGVIGFFKYLERKKYKMHVRVFLSRFKSSKTCSYCKGNRLDPKINNVKINDTSISDVTNLSIDSILEWFKKLDLSNADSEITKEIQFEISSRLTFLKNIGLGYLSLNRPTRTLSGGEFQRLNISKQLGSELSDTLYVLDEPTIGLHPRDNKKLIDLLLKLHSRNNTLVVVEHDAEVIRAAQEIIEIGPLSGELGGKVSFQGSIESFLKSNALTASYLRGEKKTFTLTKNPLPEDFIEITGCQGHNLQNISLKIPINKFTCITGVSGSGKSSLITQTLFPAIRKKLTGEHQQDSLPFKNLKVSKKITSIDFVDQQKVSKSKRSSISTYLKIFDHIRKLMANLPESKVLGYSAGSFSLNTEGGRCPTCKGIGSEEVEMLFMDNIHLVCESCQGRKYTSEILKIKYKNLSIFEILSLSCSEAIELFKDHISIIKPLKILKYLGLDYLKLGQTLDTLSGGENQRLKLSKFLLSSGLKGRLLIFDEPSTGLHFKEIQMLNNVFKHLTESGATVIVIEHNLDIIASSDWIIDVGPEAGTKGGKIVAFGSPLDIAKTKTHTGLYLKKHINGANIF